MVHCKATNDNASSSVEVPYEIFPVDLEEQRKKLENEISILVEEGKKEREEIQKRQEELKNELDELTKYDEEQVEEVKEEEVKEEEVKKDTVEVTEEKLIEEEETAEEEVKEEVKKEAVADEVTQEVVKNQEEIIQKEVTNGLENILERFGNRLERIINKLEVIENKQQKHHHHAVDVEIVEPVVEKPHRPLTPPPAKPQPPTTPAKPHPPTTPAPHPPTTPVAKPHPPTTPAPHPPAETLTEKKPHKPLNFEIMNLHNKYSSENIENNLVDVIIDHMKCVDTYHISGKEKKEMVLNSIDTLLSTNEMRSDNKKILRNLSSKLIDTFYSLDKHKINISEKLPTTFSCFPR
jgi:hypothetical protein